MKKYFLLFVLIIGAEAFAQQQRIVSPASNQVTKVSVPSSPAPSQEALEQQLLQLQEENQYLTGQLNAERLKPDRLTQNKEEVESDLAKLSTERQRSIEACTGEQMDPQKLRNVLGFTIATLVESGLGTAANVVSVVSTLKNWEKGGGGTLTSKKGDLSLGDGNKRTFDNDNKGLGVGATKLNLGVSIAATTLSAASTVTSAIAHKNLVDIRDGVAACRATFGTWY